MILRNTLLAVVVWLGGGGFMLFVNHHVVHYRDTPAEAPLLRLIATSGPIVAIATVLVAITGALMSWFDGWGFFQVLWLGIKQGIMVAVLVTMVGLEGRFRRLANEINALPPGRGSGTPEIREVLQSVHLPEVAMRLGALFALGPAVWRPT